MLPQGMLLPTDVTSEHWFLVLAAFVALNTIMYLSLAIAKMLPKVYLSTLLPRHYRRSETRSIHPDGPL